MEEKIQSFFENGHYELARNLMMSQSIDMIDLDINKMLIDMTPSQEISSSFTTGHLINRTRDFVLEIMSDVPNGKLWSVWICDLRGRCLDESTVREYGDL